MYTLKYYLNLENTYLISLQASSQFQNLVDQVNANRENEGLDDISISLAFDPEQTVRDAIRGYNGWFGQDPVDNKLHLHEYALAYDAYGLLSYHYDPTTGNYYADWYEVPPSARPQTKGDPNYVDDVLSQMV